jgi:S1-C subfamily serine protease
LGDVIQSVDGKKVSSSADLLEVLETRKAGDVVRVDVLRDNRRQQVQVRLDAASRQ